MDTLDQNTPQDWQLALLDYYSNRQTAATPTLWLCSTLTALNETLSETDSQALARRAGQHLAEQMTLTDCATLNDLQQAVNKLLQQQGWGLITYQEADEYLLIHHYAFPLLILDLGHTDFLLAFFEGMHGQWLRQAGAGDALTARYWQQQDVPVSVQIFRFGYFSGD